MPREEKTNVVTVGDNWLGSSIPEKDPRILADNRLNMGQKCDAVANQVNVILGCINRHMTCKLWEVMVSTLLSTN